MKTVANNYKYFLSEIMLHSKTGIKTFLAYFVLRYNIYNTQYLYYSVFIILR